MIPQAKFGTTTSKFTCYELLCGTTSRLALPFGQSILTSDDRRLYLIT